MEPFKRSAAVLRSCAHSLYTHQGWSSNDLPLFASVRALFHSVTSCARGLIFCRVMAILTTFIVTVNILSFHGFSSPSGTGSRTTYTITASADTSTDKSKIFSIMAAALVYLK